jgi:hypothetical protein
MIFLIVMGVFSFTDIINCKTCKRFLQNYEKYDIKRIWMMKPTIRREVCKVRVPMN